MKLALIIPPIDDVLSNFGKDVEWGWWQPLGLLSVAGYAKNKIPDIDILICDEQETGGFNETMTKVENFKPDWIGISPDYFTMRNSLALAAMGKAIGSMVVFGGHYATNRAEVILRNRPEVDYVVMEDGEQAMSALLAGRRPEDIPNLCRREGKIIRCNKIEWGDLDAITAVDYSLVEMENYFKRYRDNASRTGIGAHFQRPLVFSSQRGCRWRESSKGGCIYCSCIYPHWRGRNVKLVWRDIMDCQEKYKIDSLAFTADDFLSDPWWFEQFYEARPEGKRPGIRFMYVRPDSLNEEMCKKLAELGCFHVFLGLESADGRCLKALKKGLSKKVGLRAAKILKNNGITIGSGFVLGAPGETAESIERTKEMAYRIKELGGNNFNAYPLFPSPGSAGWSMLMEKNIGSRHLFENEDILDLEMMMYIWNKEFCLVPLEKILEVCDEINKLSSTSWNALAIKK